jgi:hypothetical protein
MLLSNTTDDPEYGASVPNEAVAVALFLPVFRVPLHTSRKARKPPGGGWA